MGIYYSTCRGSSLYRRDLWSAGAARASNERKYIRLVRDIRTQRITLKPRFVLIPGHMSSVD